MTDTFSLHRNCWTLPPAWIVITRPRTHNVVLEAYKLRPLNDCNILETAGLCYSRTWSIACHLTAVFCQIYRYPNLPLPITSFASYSASRRPQINAAGATCRKRKKRRSQRHISYLWKVSPISCIRIVSNISPGSSKLVAEFVRLSLTIMSRLTSSSSNTPSTPSC